jgi:hypothetical protein
MVSNKQYHGISSITGYNMVKRLLITCAILLTALNTFAQTTLVSDQSTQLIIPDIIDLEASATHLYVLSESEGLAVFRTNSDTLQFIFTSEGMSNRGNTMQSDVRFAYLYGAGNRLTVLEPTSLLGVYSATVLPHPPRSVTRVGTNLFVALGAGGLAKLSLNYPSVFDSEPEFITINNQRLNVTDIVRMPLQVILLLGNNELAFFNISGDEIVYSNTITLSDRVIGTAVVNNELKAYDNAGNFYTVRSSGQLQKEFSIQGTIDRVRAWNDYLVLRTVDGLLYLQRGNSEPVLVRSNQSAGNIFTIAQNRLWLTNFSELSNHSIGSGRSISGSNQPSAAFQIEPIQNIITPFPRPVLIPLRMQGSTSSDIRFQYTSEVTNAEIRGHGFYWQPQINQTGVHRFTITATNASGMSDNTSFTVDVRAFNSPPRFNPLRPVTIAVDENFTLPIKAVDPDGLDPDLIRYHGVDLPEGSSISERTGIFNWTPDRRQVGIHRFQVIATDQYGAAASVQVDITVRNLSREE